MCGRIEESFGNQKQKTKKLLTNLLYYYIKEVFVALFCKPIPFDLFTTHVCNTSIYLSCIY